MLFISYIYIAVAQPPATTPTSQEHPKQHPNTPPNISYNYKQPATIVQLYTNTAYILHRQPVRQPVRQQESARE